VRSPERAREERVLFERLRDPDDPMDRDVLVERFLPLAHAIAARFACSREPFDDLFQVACLALVKAIDRFDIERGTAFSSYAVPTIVGELKRYFRDRTWPVSVPRDLKELALRVDRVKEQLSVSEGHAPSIPALARELHTGEEAVREALQAVSAYNAISLEVPRYRDDDGEDTLGDTLGLQDHAYGRAEERAVLDALLRNVTRREREVLRLRYEEDLTQQEISRRIGVSQMQVSRVLHGALRRLVQLAAAAPDAA
jgi:RNA polymerase sigma-B factor